MNNNFEKRLIRVEVIVWLIAGKLGMDLIPVVSALLSGG